MCLALCRCAATEPADIVTYFKGFATKQMCKDKRKHTQIRVNYFGSGFYITITRRVICTASFLIVVNNVG